MRHEMWGNIVWSIVGQQRLVCTNRNGKKMHITVNSYILKVNSFA